MHQHLLANKEVSRNITWSLHTLHYTEEEVLHFKKKIEYWTKEGNKGKKKKNGRWGIVKMEWTPLTLIFKQSLVRPFRHSQITKLQIQNKLKRKKQSKPATRFRFRSQIFLTSSRSHSSLSLGIAGKTREREDMVVVHGVSLTPGVLVSSFPLPFSSSSNARSLNSTVSFFLKKRPLSRKLYSSLSLSLWSEIDY